MQRFTTAWRISFFASAAWAMAVGFVVCDSSVVARAATWEGFAGDSQHTGLSSVASQPLETIRWQMPVDLAPQYSGENLLIHYGSPVITDANTVIVPVKTGATGGFEIRAVNGSDGSLKWTQPTDYVLPPQGQGATYSWTPSYNATIAGDTLYYPGAGGTVYSRGALDANSSVVPVQQAFYGSLTNYQAAKAAYDAGVAISTPITADASGNIYFGYQTSDTAPGGLTNGVARISSSGVGSYFTAAQLQVGGNSAGMRQVVTNSAPALSADGSTLYVAMSSGSFGPGRLVAFDSATLTPTASVSLIDPKTLTTARLPNIGTASPMVGPDGDVYMGVFDNSGTSRGWMEHFSADLSTAKPTGGFGWDVTASVVPAAMVPSYQGSSSYLIMTKYNNYAGAGDGRNMLAILDPNDTQIDMRVNYNGAGGATIMKEILTIVGPTSDDDYNAIYPDAVREWCINTAVVDPATGSILVNNEDGKLYRWNLATNTLTQSVTITAGLGQAYTPTLIGPDGTVYAINNATLFAVGAVPEPGSATIAAIAAVMLVCWRWRRRG